MIVKFSRFSTFFTKIERSVVHTTDELSFIDSASSLQPRTDLEPLFTNVLTEYDKKRRTLDFVRDRISRLWSHWVAAAAGQHRQTWRHYRAHGEPPTRLRILLHLGLLTRVVNWKIAESSSKGGPLGELVQWSDLIASLYAMGHDLRVTTEVEQLGK